MMRVLTHARCPGLGRPACVLLISWLLSAAPCHAQNVKYAAWDRFYYNVRQPLKAVAPQGSVTLFVYQSYPTPLHDVTLRLAGGEFRAATVPPTLAKLDPTEIKTFTIKLRRQGGHRASDSARLTLQLRARELPGPRSITLTVPLTAKGEKRLADALAVPVGTMEVKVGGWGNEVYYLYLLPTVALLALLLWRRRRMGR